MGNGAPRPATVGEQSRGKPVCMEPTGTPTSTLKGISGRKYESKWLRGWSSPHHRAVPNGPEDSRRGGSRGHSPSGQWLWGKVGTQTATPTVSPTAGAVRREPGAAGQTYSFYTRSHCRLGGFRSHSGHSWRSRPHSSACSSLRGAENRQVSQSEIHTSSVSWE